jgi:ketol-acid reductoisomerase
MTRAVPVVIGLLERRTRPSSWSVCSKDARGGLRRPRRPREIPMTTIHHEEDGDLQRILGEKIAVVGYGNQGRSWALNLRDSGADVRVCVRADASRDAARADGFDTGELADANDAPIACVLVPDDVIPHLPLDRPADGLTVIASGYSVAFGRWSPRGDVGLVAPRMLGPEVRRCYEEGAGFITAVGVHADVTGQALARTLAVARAIGGLREGAIELTPKQEAVLDLAVEQVLSPALAHVNQSFVMTMLGAGIPIEAVLTELFMSGEVERNYRLLREVGFTGQLGFHSPASQYGQLSRRGAYDSLDFASVMQALTADIESGRFADEWDAEAESGFQKLAALREQFAGPAIRSMESELRSRLGPGVRDRGAGDDD